MFRKTLSALAIILSTVSSAVAVTKHEGSAANREPAIKASRQNPRDKADFVIGNMRARFRRFERRTQEAKCRHPQGAVVERRPAAIGVTTADACDVVHRHVNIGATAAAQIHAPSEAVRWPLTHRFKPTKINLTESHSLLAMAAVILLRRGNGIGWRPAAAGDVR
jgi:hypothetical protein